MSGIQVSRSLRIPEEELRWRFTGAGGPGGQHANTANTRVEVVWDIAASAAPGPRQRTLLLEKLGPSVRVVASDERSQVRNRELALERLRARVADALHVQAPRRPTRPTRGSTERRLEDKRRQAERKLQRRRGGDES
ncbi:MAG: alternative ribosome rescue aminoacyl-tRNA hydrolase ArfB [Acidimicrobiales bacterium]